MTTLDSSLNIPDPVEISPRPTAMRYGGIAGLLMVVMGLTFYLFGITDMTDPESTGNKIGQWLNYGIMIAAVAMAIKNHKENELGGYITYGRCLGVGTLTGLVMGVIGAVWSVLFFTVIAPELVDQIREMAHEQALEQGTTEEQLEQAKGIMNFFTSPTFFAIVMILGGVIIGFITSLIAGAIWKKEPPASFS